MVANATNATATVSSTVAAGGLNWTQVIIACSCIAGFVLLIFSLRKFQRSRGRVWQNHLYFVAVTAILIYFTPLKIKEFCFNPLTIAIVGSALPIYESSVAVATQEIADDKIWLTYWVAHGSIQYTTYWMDNIASKNQDQLEWWFVLSFFTYLWFLLPFTDGSALLYDYFTEPFLAPIVTPIAKQLEGFISQIIAIFVSSTHIWFLWAAFAFFPSSFKKFIALSFGHIYPIMASIVALMTPYGYDDTEWLTYWVCFMPMLIIMEFLEQWLRKVPGFYVAMLFGTAYLMVPLFRGSDKVFRGIIVPLAGLEELLAVRDAVAVKEEIERKIPKDRHHLLKTQIVDIFQKDSPTESTGLI